MRSDINSSLLHRIKVDSVYLSRLQSTPLRIRQRYLALV